MSFIEHFKVLSRDLDGFPITIVITFSSGDEASYLRKEGGFEEEKSQSLTKTLPKYDFGEFNPNESDLRAQYAVCTKTLRKMMRKFKSSLREASELREKAQIELDRQYENWERILRNDYINQKKKWQNLKRKLEASEGRLQMVVKQLKETNLEIAPAVIKMLQNEAEFIAKRMELIDLKFETFLSHVQKPSGDLCGRLSDSLTSAGITSWYDMSASKLDAQGMIEGVINSKIFTVVLTKRYFERQYCLFEYSIAVIAGKPILAIYETDERLEGGRIDEFNIPKVFKQTLMNHEIIKVNRRPWRSFFSLFEQAIKARQSYVSVFTDSNERVKQSSTILKKDSDISFLKGSLHSSGWKFGERIFSSTVDGFTVKSFHDKCDEKGGTLTVAKRKSGVIFGGFMPFSWKSVKGEFVDAPEAWVFTLADQTPPKLIGREHGQVKGYLHETTGPYFKVCLPSGDSIEFGLHGTEKENHFIEGVFAGNKSNKLEKPVKIDEYEVFQVLKTHVCASV